MKFLLKFLLVIMLFGCIPAFGDIKTGLMQEDVGLYNVMKGQAGAAFNGTTINNAIGNASSTNKIIFLPPGTWTLNVDVTVPSTRGLMIPKGTIINKNGYALVVNGPFLVDDDNLAWNTGTGTFLWNHAPLKQSGGMNVKLCGAKMDGVTDDTMALNTCLSTYAHVFVPEGTLVHSETINIAFAGHVLSGASSDKSILKHTGTGIGVSCDGGGTGQGINNVEMRNLTLQGNVNTTDGLWIRVCHRSLFTNIRVRDANAAALRQNFTILNTFINFTYSINEHTAVQRPVNCIVLDQRAGSGIEPVTTNTFINTICEGATGAGIALTNSSDGTFLGGTSEANGGYGIFCPLGCIRNTFTAFDLESNTSGAVHVADGIGNLFQQGFYSGSGTVVLFDGTAIRNTIQGTHIAGNVSIVYPSHDNVLRDLWLITTTGAVTDSGVNTSWQNVVRYTGAGTDVRFPDRNDNVETHRFLGGRGLLPSLGSGAGCGAGGCTSGSMRTGSTMLSGQATMTTAGGGMTANALVARIEHAGGEPDFPSANQTVILTPANANAAALSGATQVVVGNVTVTGFDIISGPTALAIATTYSWNYLIFE